MTLPLESAITMTRITARLARTHVRGAVAAGMWLWWGGPAQAQSPMPVRGVEQHVVTLADLMRLRHVPGPSALALSPDGTRLAYVLADDDETYDTLMVIGTTNVTTPRALGAGIMPRWSPRGHVLAFYSARGDGRTLQLWLYDDATGALRQLTHVPGGIQPSAPLSAYNDSPLLYTWSPDGTRIAFTAEVSLAAPSPAGVNQPYAISPSGRPGPLDTARRSGTPMVLDGQTPLAWAINGIFPATFGNRFENGRLVQETTDPTTGSPRVANELFITDVASGQVRRLTADMAGYFYPDWSPDGHTVAVASPEGRPATVHLPDTTNIYLIDVASGHAAALTSGAGMKLLPAWSPDGKWIAYCVVPGLFGMHAIMVARSTGGEPPRDLTAQLDRQVYEFTWAPDARAVLAAVPDGPFHPIVRLDLTSGRVTPATPVGNITHYFALARSGTMVWAYNDPQHRDVLALARTPGAPAQPLVDLNPQTATWRLGEQRVVHWHNHTGDTVDGILVLPTAYQAGVRYPLIVDGYSGFRNELQSSTIQANQTLAGRGYAVFLPGHRAPHTYQNYELKGKVYTDKGKGPPGIGVLVDDILSGVDTLIAQGIADSSRMCLFGYSNGGGTVNYMITHTARFRCAVSASAAVTDRATDFFVSGDPAYPMFWDEGHAPWQRPDVYVAVSPVYHLDQVRTPLLLSIGDHDAAMLLGTLEMYRGLRWLGRDVTLLRYPGQSHELEGAALEDFWTRVYAFFDQYLKAIPARQN